MFGDLFEEDYSSVSTTNQYGKGKELKAKPLEPPAPREFTNLSGIRNQGGTCYLNSLLQTLHFTPEFREALFSLGPEELGSLEEKDNPDAKVRIIPLQLQRLFAQLLLLDQEAASTADLTDSFGWTSNEEMRQHDVQELNRILFSALETSLVGTSGHDLINRLYHGTIVNQIVCKECKNVSEKQEDFLDLTVAVKNVTGLEDALWNMYVEEEVFDCDNLYHCGSCDRLVKAAKSAKLRKLPPFLTVSLLRFNFDFVKCERYKETSCYTFPLRINLKPFCEQSQLDDLEYMYDLFSVIIHKGGCYGGHYHVYIKDVDHLGNWQLQEEKSKPDVNLKDLQNEEEIDDPLMILKTILSQEESNLILVDLLGQKFLKKIGISWNKKYRKQYGPLRKFLQLHSQIFLLSSDQSKVSLLKNSSLQAESDLQRKDQQIFKTLTSESPGLNDRTSCSHWFDINDSKVQPIEEKDIKQQFQGKESAYMLFYRKSQLQRPPEARANPRYRVPCHLLNEMDAANIELQTKRTEYDSTNNIFELHLHLGPHYHFFNGALHPVVSQTESVWDLTFDKRKTLGDLRQSIFQLLEFWEGDMVLSVAKFVPAGLHIYQTLDGDDLTLCDIEIADEEDIFVWNGVEVGGIQIPTGIDCEPLLLNVLHPATGSEECRQLVESPLVFPANAEVGTVFTALAIPGGVIFTSNTASVGGESWTAIPKEDLKKTFREQGLRNGSSILIQDSSNDNNSLLTKQGKWITTVNEVDWVQVNNLCQLESEEEQVKISATVNAVVFDIRIKAIKELKLMKELAENSCLRPIDRNGKLLCPVPDSYTLKEAELKMGSSLGLCPGRAPTSSQLFLFFAMGSDIQPGSEMEIIVEETISVRECLKIMLEKFGLPGDTWHLRKMDWCYEAGEPLCEEGNRGIGFTNKSPVVCLFLAEVTSNKKEFPYSQDATLKELMLCSGDTLLLTEGKLPSPGLLNVPIWWYQPPGPKSQGKRHLDQTNCTPSQGGVWRATSTPGAAGDVHADVPLRYLGDVKISEDATLGELKAQAMTLPSLSEFFIPSPAFLRAWTVDSKRPGRLLRKNQQQLREYKLGRRTEICLEPLQKEEHLGPQDMLLRTQMRLPGERAYALPMDMVWDAARGTASSLRQRVADFYSLPVEKIEIAKYFPDKFEWLPVSSWNQQITKRKKKKKQDNLQGAPYYLKDGDIIGIKNLLVEEDDDFSTVRDDIGREDPALGKRKSLEALRVQSNSLLSSAETPGRPHRPEASLSIHVGSFR
ncbi:ubiquitin carboxyl-terminal hydrolase 40 isoform X1 [Myotis myotis]|uniref:ubiquitin carboxyl-terminal hydrolase 40 isoform X1 n=1 Tax=Myotis myotis TaxID=51298 RepID=UPI0017487BD6|nr:ubiquitin carboxyl-terminal hydrolase 40 isoform X1 [Myotis myotis]XP_036175827.1 ubiquitin carboxyl-terminal hydrolase 40 isoform X1 [Myotis myotis]XP_036175828.1 ubiquitin carboxyl-terminal hydrolase 40 isoform X1 [Myotis myotis]XP_036175829.1 ubiquitin carboxyl-terminal hydrolase 40 isoform X1 [Myotis myotis]